MEVFNIVLNFLVLCGEVRTVVPRDISGRHQPTLTLIMRWSKPPAGNARKMVLFQTSTRGKTAFLKKKKKRKEKQNV